MKILIGYLTMKDGLSKFILMSSSFGAPLFNDHDDLIGPLFLILVDMHHGCENFDGMGGIRLVDGYVFELR